MSGYANINPMPDQNILYNAASGATLLGNQTAQNALMQSQQLFPVKLQAAQQDVGNAEMGMVGRIAGSLLQLPDENARAAAYPGLIADARANGFKLANAPATYPGETVTRSVAARGLTVPEQYQYGLVTAPGFDAAIRAATAPLPGQPGYGGPAAGGGAAQGGGVRAPAPPGAYGQGGPGADIKVPPEYMPFYQEASARTGIPVPVLIAQHRQESGFNPNAVGRAGEIGVGQIMPSTAMAPGYGMAPLGTDPDAVKAALRDPRTNINFSADYLKARLRGDPSDPETIRRGLAAYNGGGDPNYVANVTRYLPASAGTQTAAAPPPGTATGAPATPGRYQVASNAPVPPPASGGAPPGSAPVTGPMTDEAWLANQAQSYPGLAGPNDTSQAPVPPPGATAAPAAPPAAPAKPMRETFVTGPDGQPVKALVPADGSGPPVPVPAAAPAAPPPATAAASPPPSPQNPLAPPPAAAPPAAPPAATQPPPGTGTNSPQFQAALELNRRAAVLDAQTDPTGRLKAVAAGLRAQAQLYLQADSVIQNPDGTQTKQLTGERLNAAAPNAHYVWDDTRGAFVDTTGIHPPVTPPSPRLTNVEGVGVVQSKPGGGAQVVVPMNPAGMTTQKAAEAQGTGVGQDVAKQLPALAEQGRQAATAEGNIDYGLSQLDKAKAGGINTGYFSGALTTVQSALKSLGLPTDKIPFINVDPNAIGNIQTARKTLAVVSGAILQQIIGSGSPITDSKIEAYIHAQPGIETDPDAVRRVLAWARSQFTYEREMSAAGMEAAANSPTGTLPLNWQPNYYRTHGFAPIYNPSTGEMQQPDGGAPGRTSPTTTPQYSEGQTATGPDGHKLVFRGGQWGPQ